MDDFEEYEFSVDAYSPETIPMERLAEYMLNLAKLMANGDRVHFREVRSGSTVLVAQVEREAAPKVAKRLHDVAHRDAANDAIAVFDRLNELLREDNAVALLRRPASRLEAEVTVVRFVGREAPTQPRMGPFTEPATIEGELVRIGGKDLTAHATIVDAEGRSWPGEVSRELAQRLRAYLYEGPVVRANGQARWERLETGEWLLRSLRFADFTIVEKDSLESAAQRLQGMAGTEWGRAVNLDDAITSLRGNGEGLH